MTTKKFKIKADEFVDLVPQMGGCFATDKITVEGMKVGYMYREEPGLLAIMSATSLIFILRSYILL